MSFSVRKAADVLFRDPAVFLRVAFTRTYNAALVRRPRTAGPTDSPSLTEIIRHAGQRRTDISDHLVPLFVEAIETSPLLIVELGVRGGESTFVFERVSRLTGATLVSVDIQDCSNSSSYENWIFVQTDDIAFAKRFASWCAQRQLTPAIDVLFIDTSHQYEHTVHEIQHWMPFMGPRSKVILHDTNMRHIYRRKDGSLGVTPHQHRGVIAALERYFGASFDERVDFVDVQKGWLIKHWANSSGFTVLSRIDPRQ